MPAGMMVLSDASRARNYTRNTKRRIARKAAARYRKKIVGEVDTEKRNPPLNHYRYQLSDYIKETIKSFTTLA